MIIKTSQIWPMKPLGVLCNIVMGQAPNGNSYNEEMKGTPLIAGAADLGFKYPKPKKFTSKPTRLSKKGDIILCVRATIGNMNWADNVYCLGRGVSGIRGKKDVDLEFIYYWILANKEHLLSLGRGATFKQISKEDIQNLLTPVLPIDQQRRIVARIKACMERVEEIRKLREKSLIDAKNLFSIKVSNIFSNSSWPQKNLKNLLKEPIKNGIFKRKKDFGEGSLLCNVKDLYSDDVVSFHNMDRVRVIDQEITKYKIEDGDVLVNRSSLKKEGLGRSCLFLGSPEPILFECHIMKVKLNKNQLHPYLFTVFMNSPLGQKEILKKAKTATMTTWNQNDLSLISIPIPPIKIQNKLVDELFYIKEFCSKMQNLIQKNNEQEIYLSQSILQKAFSGEL